MKKFLIILLLSTLLLTLTACGGTKEENIVIDVDALADELGSANLTTDTLSSVSEKVLTNILSLNVEDIESYLMYMGTGQTAEEYGVFTCVSSEAAVKIAEQLQSRVDAQKAVYADYAPDTIPRLNNAIIRQKGIYVAYVVAENYADSLKMVDTYF